MVRDVKKKSVKRVQSQTIARASPVLVQSNLFCTFADDKIYCFT